MIEPTVEKKRFLAAKIDKMLRRDQNDKKLTHFIKVDKWHSIYAHNPKILKEALSFGPVVMHINGRPFGLLFYSRGIIKGKWCKPKRNHAVLAVGYGVQEPK